MGKKRRASSSCGAVRSCRGKSPALVEDQQGPASASASASLAEHGQRCRRPQRFLAANTATPLAKGGHAKLQEGSAQSCREPRRATSKEQFRVRPAVVAKPKSQAR